jgi:hypothetical protein
MQITGMAGTVNDKKGQHPSPRQAMGAYYMALFILHDFFL